MLPARRRPDWDAELAPRAEVPVLHSVPAAAGACEAVTAAFVGFCQGTLYSWKGFSVSVCRRCFDSDWGGGGKEEKPSSMKKQQIKSKGKCVQAEI